MAPRAARIPRRGAGAFLGSFPLSETLRGRSRPPGNGHRRAPEAQKRASPAPETSPHPHRTDEPASPPARPGILTRLWYMLAPGIPSPGAFLSFAPVLPPRHVAVHIGVHFRRASWAFFPVPGILPTMPATGPVSLRVAAWTIQGPAHARVFQLFHLSRSFPPWSASPIIALSGGPQPLIGIPGVISLLGHLAAQWFDFVPKRVPESPPSPQNQI